MINREQGAGSRVLLDENLKLLGIFGSNIKGYKKETSSHLAVASAVSRGEADVAVGNEKIARQVDNIEFIPMKKERYDLVLRKEDMKPRCFLLAGFWSTIQNGRTARWGTDHQPRKPIYGRYRKKALKHARLVRRRRRTSFWQQVFPVNWHTARSDFH